MIARALCCMVVIGSVSSPSFAQTREQIADEARFNRALYQTHKKGDCHATLELIEARRLVLARRAAKFVDRDGADAKALPLEDAGEANYLAIQIEGLENRLKLERQRCDAKEDAPNH